MRYLFLSLIMNHSDRCSSFGLTDSPVSLCRKRILNVDAKEIITILLHFVTGGGKSAKSLRI